MAPFSIAATFSKATMDLDISAFSLKETALLSRGTSTNIDGHFGLEIDSDLKLILWPVASFSSGQQASRDALNPLTNIIYLKEASVEKATFYETKIKVGALYQKEFLPGIAGQAKAFPAMGIIFPWKILTRHQFEVRAQAAVPTSSGLATSANELESSSNLFSATFLSKSEWSQFFATTISYSHFSFNQLSSAAATDSIRRGNTCSAISNSIFNFVYRYAGDEIQIFTDTNPTENFSFKIKSSYIKNVLAPEELNAGYFFSLEPSFKFSANKAIRPLLSYYHVQSDAMVAVFSDTNYGRNNRQGYRLGLAVDDEKYQWQFNYARSTLLALNPFQSDDESYVLSLNLSQIHF